MSEIETFTKKRLSIIIEAPFLRRLLDILDDLDVPGYTAIPALAGSGASGPWRSDSLSSDAGRMVQVVIVLDESKVPDVLKAVRGVLQRRMGIVSMMDVEVLRPELF
jgi:PII-like signaling protein